MTVLQPIVRDAALGEKEVRYGITSEKCARDECRLVFGPELRTLDLTASVARSQSLWRARRPN
jgi:hypothetical protein